MAAPIPQSVCFSNVDISQPIAPLLALEGQLNRFEIDAMAKADRLPHWEQENKKAEIRAFVNGLRADVKEMMRLKYDFDRIASAIYVRINEFETCKQTLDANNDKFRCEAQRVQEENRTLDAMLRRMNPDLAPFVQKKRSEDCLTAIHPIHQKTKKVYDQIAKFEQECLKKVENLPKQEQALYLQQVRLQVIALDKEAKGRLQKNMHLAQITHPLQKLTGIFNESLNAMFRPNTVRQHTAEESRQYIHEEDRLKEKMEIEGMIRDLEARIEIEEMMQRLEEHSPEHSPDLESDPQTEDFRET
jgi:hypothetical protein